VVLTDHANLQYYRHPQNLNLKVARYVATLADLNVKLKHLPGIKNRADPLSRRPNHDEGSGDNEQITALPDKLFTRVIETTALDKQVRQYQSQDKKAIKQWGRFGLTKREGRWWKGSALVVTRPNAFARDILETYHDSPTAGHPGIYRMYQQVLVDYWWPDLLKFIQKYVKG